jgi:GAF domain-containing protein
MSFPSPSSSDSDRLDTLARYDILDTPPEREFDRIPRLVAQLLDVPIALVSLLDEDRQWFKSCVGLDRRETKREHAFCAYNLHDASVLVVEDATKDPRFAQNPLVTGPPGIRFYAGAPLVTPDGTILGSLCAIDTTPRTVEADALDVLRDLADVVVRELELRRTNAALEDRTRQIQTLTDELKSAEETDRSRLSQLLQEELQQVLQAARMQLENVCGSDAVPAAECQRLDAVKRGLDDAMDLTRTLSSRFAPPVGNQPLRDSLEWLAFKMKEAHGLSVSVLGGGAGSGGSEDLKTLLYQLVRELLYRVVRYGDSDEARVHLIESARHLRITVEDEGHESSSTEAVQSEWGGLDDILDGIEELGGQIHVRASAGVGTCVTIKLPQASASLSALPFAPRSQAS